MRCERRREQTSSYQWGKNGEGGHIGAEEEKVGYCGII